MLYTATNAVVQE